MTRPDPKFVFFFLLVSSCSAQWCSPSSPSPPLLPPSATGQTSPRLRKRRNEHDQRLLGEGGGDGPAVESSDHAPPAAPLPPQASLRSLPLVLRRRRSHGLQPLAAESQASSPAARPSSSSFSFFLLCFLVSGALSGRVWTPLLLRPLGSWVPDEPFLPQG